MLTNTNSISVVCPHCQNVSRKRIDWLKNAGTIQCQKCAGYAAADLNEIISLAATEWAPSSAKLNLKVLPS